MKKIRFIYSLLCAIVLGACAVAGCGKIYDDEEPDDTRKGFLTIGFNINGSALTKVEMEGEDLNNENSIMEVDLYFYDDNAGKETAALYSYHENVDKGNEVSISFSALPDKMKEPGFKFKVIAVVNCGDELQKSYDKPTIKELEEFTTKVAVSGDEDSNHRTFRGVGAPQAFVMTNLTQSDNKNGGLVVDEENGTSAKISLKRLASKIRIALAINESVSDDTGTWKPDTKNMRLYFSNGVRTARLDGDVSQLTLNDDPSNPENSDYFNISTTGNKVDEDSNYSYARPINSHDTNNLTGSEDKVYTYYNDVPHYSYPSTWTESLTEAHQPTLTIVIPWEKDENGTKTYEPTYYSVPVNNNGKLESNSYYYLRTHIGMKGSSTPEVPMPVDVETEILDWGKAEDTEVELKPIRYLILNQTQFVVPNETIITIPYNSTHECEVVDFKATMYKFNGDDSEIRLVFDNNTKYSGTSQSVKGNLYDYYLDPVSQTLTFTHKFNDPIFDTTGNDNILDVRAGRGYTSNALQDEKGTYYRKTRIDKGSNKIYTRVLVEITLRHTGMPNDTPYQETVTIMVYPALYVTTEDIDPSYHPIGYGWILVNGYGDSDGTTGNLGNVRTTQTPSGDARYMTTITVTSLTEDEKKLWVIDDPRTNYINNELDPTSIKTDYANHTTTWTSGGGPYDGSQTGRHQRDTKNECRTIWQYYPDAETGTDWQVDWVDEAGTVQTWSAQNDNKARPIRYYYPGSELASKANVVAPKVTIASYHSYNAHQLTKAEARKRCASYQQYGYPAGRWRLPTKGEVEIFRYLEKKNIIKDPYGGTPFWCTQGSTNGSVNNDGTVDVNTGRSDTYDCYSRCVYDTWFWEQVDANGRAYNQIPNNGEVPEASNKELWLYFTWGDRPKEDPMASGNPEDAPTVENFIRKATQRK